MRSLIFVAIALLAITACGGGAPSTPINGSAGRCLYAFSPSVVVGGANVSSYCGWPCIRPPGICPDPLGAVGLSRAPFFTTATSGGAALGGVYLDVSGRCDSPCTSNTGHFSGIVLNLI